MPGPVDERLHCGGVTLEHCLDRAIVPICDPT
jgi:hypothetical protein